MNLPANYDFPVRYKDDGLQSFTMTFLYDSTDPVDLTGSSVKMQLKLFGNTKWEFSTDAVDTDKLISINLNVLTFPQINSWKMEVGNYSYDMQITAPDGFIRTFIKGNISFVQDITA